MNRSSQRGAAARVTRQPSACRARQSLEEILRRERFSYQLDLGRAWLLFKIARLRQTADRDEPRVRPNLPHRLNGLFAVEDGHHHVGHDHADLGSRLREQSYAARAMLGLEHAIAIF